MAERRDFVWPVLLQLSAGPGGQKFFVSGGNNMKKRFLALLGVLALVIGGVYTALLGRDIVSIKR